MMDDTDERDVSRVNEIAKARLGGYVLRIAPAPRGDDPDPEPDQLAPPVDELADHFDDLLRTRYPDLREDNPPPTLPSGDPDGDVTLLLVEAERPEERGPNPKTAVAQLVRDESGINVAKSKILSMQG
jgi:hypothetical protein